ncbi:carboxypeptidase-like regulatory domain-containing protein [Brumimicrobium mesophilum]|uniref:carboxypeptidase-like regulatory domain-containing protein n=1 Tax=Brumimicrobium mesophilum TaxID=392717 RepID=UPI000D1401EA|nr:carboxypeptidase-like regulatory domain-containing protein [Brumimicrobium mesophilum]
MKTSALTLFLFIFFYNQFYAQSYTGPFSGTITSKENAPFPNVKVVIYENDIAIDSTFTDSLGNYSFKIEFKPKLEYSSSYHHNDFHEATLDIFREATDTTINVEYFIDIQLTSYRYDKFDNSAYYEMNVIDSFSNIEIGWFKDLMDEYPLMCLKFTQSIHPNERIKTAEERMKFFENKLKEFGCDMNRICFSSEIFKLESHQLELNNKSRIQGEITSMDGSCK